MSLHHLTAAELLTMLRSAKEREARAVSEEIVRRCCTAHKTKNELVDRIVDHVRTYRSGFYEQNIRYYAFLRKLLECEPDIDVVCRILQARQEFDWHSQANLLELIRERWEATERDLYIRCLKSVAHRGEYLLGRWHALVCLGRIDPLAAKSCLGSSAILRALVGRYEYPSPDFISKSLLQLWDVAKGGAASDVLLLVCAARNTFYAKRGDALSETGHPIVGKSKDHTPRIRWLESIRGLERDESASRLEAFGALIAGWVLESNLPDPSAIVCLQQTEERLKNAGLGKVWFSAVQSFET